MSTTESNANTAGSRSALIREYVSAHPGCRARAIADALGLATSAATNQIANMARAGYLIAVGDRSLRTYTIGRAMLKAWSLPPGVALKRAQERKAALRLLTARTRKLRPVMRDLVRREPVLCAPTPDTEVYIANGGRVDVLPVNWHQPTRYPAPGFGFGA